MIVPFVSLEAQYHSISSDLKNAIDRAIFSFQFTKGKEVMLFENAFKNILESDHCISTGNGTDALFISLKSLAIGPDDEVIVPAFSWISTSEVITLCGAKPVFVDIDYNHYTIDPFGVQEKVTPKTKAIIVVHLYGQAASVTNIQEYCKKQNLLLIEDCAQAHLTQEHNRYVGTFGDVGAFSFYPTKNLGAYGDAGSIVTHSDVLAEKIRRFANHGALEKDDHLIEGTNSRMDTLQAAVLLAKLSYLKLWNEQRMQHANLYTQLLKDEEKIVTPFIRPNTLHTFHIYAVRAKRRNELQQHLLKNGIQTIIHYPKALPNLSAYRHLGHVPEDFPVANMLQEEVLSLPIYPELTEQEITYICRKIKDFYRK